MQYQQHQQQQASYHAAQLVNQWAWTHHGLAAQLLPYAICLAFQNILSSAPGVSELVIGRWFGWHIVAIVLIMTVILVPDQPKREWSGAMVSLHNYMSLIVSLAMTCTSATFFGLRVGEFITGCTESTQCGLETTSYALATGFSFILSLLGLSIILTLVITPDVRPVMAIAERRHPVTRL